MIYRTPEQVYDHWIASLENGTYDQGQGRLRNPRNGFCCLGVLCDLASKDGGPDWANNGYMPTIMEEGYNLPPMIAKYIGISYQDADTLASANDNGKSFKTIAQMIRTKIKPAALKRIRRRNSTTLAQESK